MSTALATDRVVVDVHGLRVEVRSPDAALLQAVAARLSAFPSPRPATTTALTLTHVPEPPPSASGTGRVVYTSQRCTVRYQEADDVLTAVVDTAGVRVDLRRGVGQVWGGAADSWALSHPCLALPLLETCRRAGLHPLHAAAVVASSGAVLLTGPSGAGKSTASLMLAGVGFGFVGDDTVLLRDGLVHGWADEVDVTPRTVQLLPRLAGLVEPGLRPGWPKHPLPPAAAAGSAPVPGPMPPAVLLLVQRSPDGLTATRPVPPAAALQALVGDVLLTRPDVVREHLAAFQRLVDSTPAAAVRVGRDPEEVAAVLARDLGLRP